MNGERAESKIRSLRTHPSAPVVQLSRIASFAMRANVATTADRRGLVDERRLCSRAVSSGNIPGERSH